MAEDSTLEKTEEATPKKREEAKKEGKVARSMDLIHAVSLIGFLIGISMFGDQIFSDLSGLFETYLSFSTGNLTKEGSTDLVRDLLMTVFVITAPIAMLLSVALIATNTMQTGVTFNLARISFKWNKLNPIEGVKRLFSLRGVANVGSSLFKITAILWVVITTVNGALPDVAVLGEVSLPESLSAGMDLVFLTVLRISIVILIIALFDFAYQRWQLSKDLRMSKEDLKEEFKRTEGDPKQKGRIRKAQRDLANRRMIDDAADADVIVTNPHRLAVALRYRRGEDQAPVVVAKGMNLIAKKIREVARKNGIPLVENKPLAWALYRTVDVGSFVPEKLYQSVAEVLSYIYKLKEKR